MMMHRWAGAGLVVLLAGCASAPAPVEDRSQAVTAARPPAVTSTQQGTAEIRPLAQTTTLIAQPEPLQAVGLPPEDGVPGVPANGEASGGQGFVPVLPESAPDPALSGTPVGDLLASAEGARQSGDAARAAASLERAIRIDARNPWPWHKLAALRLEQGQPALAESLAVKSNSLAGNDRDLKRRNWLLIAQIRERKGDTAGARDARGRAAELQ